MKLKAQGRKERWEKGEEDHGVGRRRRGVAPDEGGPTLPFSPFSLPRVSSVVAIGTCIARVFPPNSLGFVHLFVIIIIMTIFAWVYMSVPFTSYPRLHAMESNKALRSVAPEVAFLLFFAFFFFFLTLSLSFSPSTVAERVSDRVDATAGLSRSGVGFLSTSRGRLRLVGCGIGAGAGAAVAAVVVVVVVVVVAVRGNSSRDIATPRSGRDSGPGPGPGPEGVFLSPGRSAAALRGRELRGRSGEMMVLNLARVPRRTRPRGAYWLSAVSWVKALCRSG